jgi:predicted short-subunit dehydrogenase-like oxidoreductase (DUF2520 family)
MDQNKISFAGAGRVASALCTELFKAGNKIELVVSTSGNTSKSLAQLCDASWSTDLNFPGSTNIIIVAVPDHKLISVLHTLNCNPDVVVVHTAGSFGLDIFPENIKHRGVFYPLQTFSQGRKIDFKELPFLLEASDELTSLTLKKLAESISSLVQFVDSEHRKLLHLAAVFICNFTNYMLTMGEEVAGKKGFSIELFKPLIAETIAKALENGPKNSQTGPAVRNDKITIEKHLDLLSFSPELQQLYKEVTQSIIGYYKHKN